MDADHCIPFFGGAGEKHAVAHEACIVDHGMKRAEAVEGLLDHALARFPFSDVVGVGDGFPAHRADLVHDLLGRALGRACLAMGADAKVIDDDLAALCGEAQRIGFAKAIARPGHDRNTSFADTHFVLLLGYSILSGALFAQLRGCARKPHGDGL